MCPSSDTVMNGNDGRIISVEEAQAIKREATAHHRWKGIHKLTEECGEVLQVIGKINVFPDGDHPDGGPPLRDRIADELVDLEAAIHYFRETNGIEGNGLRFADKINKFRRWGLTGVL